MYLQRNILMFPAGSSIRQKVLGELRKTYKTVAEAEDALGLTIETYLEDSPCAASGFNDTHQLNVSPALLGRMRSLTKSQICELVVEGLASLWQGNSTDSFVMGVSDVLLAVFEKQEYLHVVAILDKLYVWSAGKMGITSNPRTFVQLSLEAMRRLEDNNKVNLVFKFCQGLALDRPDKSGPLMPINRMPFGLVQYCIEFFTCTNIMQVIIIPRRASIIASVAF